MTPICGALILGVIESLGLERRPFKSDAFMALLVNSDNSASCTMGLVNSGDAQVRRVSGK